MLLGLMLLGVVGVFYYLRGKGADEHKGQLPEQAARPADEGNAPPAARVDRELLGEVKDSTPEERVVREREPLLHLLMESGKLVPGDFRRLKARLLDDDPFQAIETSPAEHRGEPWVVKARYLSCKAEQIMLDVSDTTVTQGLTCHVGLARDDNGRAYSFSVLEEPRDFSPGQVLRLNGFFFKKVALFDPGSGDLVDPTLHFVGKEILHSFLAIPPVTELDLPFLESVRDYELEDQANIRDDALWHVLSYVINTDAETISATGQDCTQKMLLDRPTELRGQAVRVLGSFHDHWERQLGPGGENPLDLMSVYHSLLVHFGPCFTYLISAERPPDWIREKNVNVIAEGIFLQRYCYVAKSHEVITCPLIVVKRFVKFTVRDDSLRKIAPTAIVGAGVVLLGWVLYSSRRDRRVTSELQRKLVARKRARFESQITRTPPGK